MKKTIALLLALLMCLTLFGCGGKDDKDNNDNEKFDPAEALIGKWTTEMDVEKIINLSQPDMGDNASQFMDVFKGITMKLNLEFKEDNKFVLSMDKDSAEQVSSQMTENLRKMLPGMLAAQFGIDESMLESVMASQGMSLDDMMDSMMKNMDMGEAFSENMEGAYRYEDGKLYLKADTDDEAGENEEVTMTVEISKKELKITDVKGNMEEGYDEEAIKSFLPLIFTK